MNTINWYPGHMAKAKRELTEQIKRVDLVIELCDARLPVSTRNPDLNQMIGSKKRILILNKADLSDPSANSAWINYFRESGIHAALMTSTKAKSREMFGMIEQATKEIIEKAAAKGVRKTVRVMVVGVPNAGKSTLINSLNGRAIATTGDRPGVTKSTQWVKITPWLELLDTPGILWPKLDDQIAARRLSYIGTVKDDILDLYQLTISLLEDLAAIKSSALKERFKIGNPEELSGVEFLDAVCKGRGFLLKGGLPDYDRCCSIVLDEFRAGKLGRITLEYPDKQTNGQE